MTPGVQPRAAVHSNARRADHGGGVTYCMALASALAATWNVDLYFPFAASHDELRTLLPAFGASPRIRQAEAVPGGRVAGLVRRVRLDRAYDAVIVQSPHVPRATWCPRAYALCEFPFTTALTMGDRARLNTFGTVIANSRFTAGWIARRWGRHAAVLHPPVRSVTPLAKRPYILAVGRFTGGGRSKRQEEMVRMFRRLTERGLRDWELHLAGFAHDRAFLDRIRADAAGLPVHVHRDLSRPALDELYGYSSVFWHATGVGVDPDREPERMEHFGIATVEAMSAGAVPVVIDGGGQPEIVAHGVSGLLWRTFEECEDLTWSLIRDDRTRARMAEAAAERARNFDFPVFAQRVRELFDGRSAL